MKNIKPGQLIRLALADLEKVEAKPETYAVDMDVWHRPWNDKCQVCLAGSVMAMTLKLPPDKQHGPSEFPECMNALCALSYFRAGLVDEGLKHLSIPIPDQCQPRFPVTTYHRNSKQFKQDMLALADLLETFDL